MSMRRIADKIEYSPTTIYLYFKDKAELLEQVCAESFSRLVQRLTKINEQPGEPLEKMRRGLLAYIQFGLENPHHYRATFMMPIPELLELLDRELKPERRKIEVYLLGIHGRHLPYCGKLFSLHNGWITMRRGNSTNWQFRLQRTMSA